MSDTPDPVPAAPAPETKASRPGKKAAFLFVENTSERMLALHRITGPCPGPGAGFPTDTTNAGRGLNWIRAEYVEATPDMHLIGLRAIDPTKIPDSEVARMLQRTTSRQALIEWRRVEKRQHVTDAITDRLANRKPAQVDAEA